MTVNSRPERGEAAEYYFKYIDLVPEGDISAILETQLEEALALLGRMPAERVDFRYAPDKWTVREVLSHVNDTERLFAFRAFWFARGFESALPSFDQDVAVARAGAGGRSWSSHVDEFRWIRASTVSLFRHLPADAWTRRGVASGNPVTVRALAYITAGHGIHHANILRERYLPQGADARSGRSGSLPPIVHRADDRGR